MKFAIKTSLLAITFATSLTSMADTLSGTIVFDRKAPFAGALYAKENSAGNTKAEMDQTNKVFDKKIVAVGNGGNIEFKNSDEFQHNIFANDPNSGAQFDVGLMESGSKSELAVTWRENTLTRIGCKIHPKMRSYILNVPTKTFQLFEFEKKVKEYKVELKNVDSATESFVLSIPKYDDLEVNLAEGESKTVDILKNGKRKGQLTLIRG